MQMHRGVWRNKLEGLQANSSMDGSSMDSQGVTWNGKCFKQFVFFCLLVVFWRNFSYAVHELPLRSLSPLCFFRWKKWDGKSSCILFETVPKLTACNTSYDLMHCKFLGSDQVVFGSCVYLLCFAILDQTPLQNLRECWNFILQYYKDHQIVERYIEAWPNWVSSWKKGWSKAEGQGCTGAIPCSTSLCFVAEQNESTCGSSQKDFDITQNKCGNEQIAPSYSAQTCFWSWGSRKIQEMCICWRSNSQTFVSALCRGREASICCHSQNPCNIALCSGFLLPEPSTYMVLQTRRQHECAQSFGKKLL